MAPSAIYEDSIVVDVKKSGQALEDMSDRIDAVNVLKSNKAPAPAPQAQQDEAFDSESRFDSAKDKGQFRQYEEACDRVKNFYREQHEKQTVAYNLKARAHFASASRKRMEMTVWEAMEKLNTLIDESDPDTSLSQIQHLLQSAEAIRRDAPLLRRRRGPVGRGRRHLPRRLRL
ncbi:inositol oxygenase 1 [Gaeumannomyces tritici R3-111a-1]|uniref:Inositol oxygenase n=1 Tax=Gaeumannomyces tritici (strain R3-111a-1) TaxID=644352 RepID=J3PB00_GAET3|nr:inositol oxygenase 1 [Gaeumannomyces tritici R3-111a-1]EJT71416.1 inositol oxygenase 1 [Gaeumannomyces tritici R3-111a-1]